MYNFVMKNYNYRNAIRSNVNVEGISKEEKHIFRRMKREIVKCEKCKAHNSIEYFKIYNKMRMVPTTKIIRGQASYKRLELALKRNDMYVSGNVFSVCERHVKNKTYILTFRDNSRFKHL